MYADLCVCLCYHVNVGPLVSSDELSTAQQLANTLDPTARDHCEREPHQPLQDLLVSIARRQTAEADLRRNTVSCRQPSSVDH